MTLRKRGIEVIHYPHTKTIRGYLQREGATFDVVILSRCDYRPEAHPPTSANTRRRAGLSLIRSTCIFFRQGREADLVGDPELKRQAKEKCELEYELIDQADETWVVSPAEQELLRQTRPEKSIEVVSNIVDIPGSATPFSLRRDFLFIGSFQHPPNIDAVLFLPVTFILWCKRVCPP